MPGSCKRSVAGCWLTTTFMPFCKLWPTPVSHNLDSKSPIVFRANRRRNGFLRFPRPSFPIHNRDNGGAKTENSPGCGDTTTQAQSVSRFVGPRTVGHLVLSCRFSCPIAYPLTKRTLQANAERSVPARVHGFPSNGSYDWGRRGFGWKGLLRVASLSDNAGCY